MQHCWLHKETRDDAIDSKDGRRGAAGCRSKAQGSRRDDAIDGTEGVAKVAADAALMVAQGDRDDAVIAMRSEGCRRCSIVGCRKETGIETQ